MVNPFVFILERLVRPVTEPEYEEPVEHDKVMSMVGGQMVEVTRDDPEVRQQQ